MQTTLSNSIRPVSGDRVPPPPNRPVLPNGIEPPAWLLKLSGTFAGELLAAPHMKASSGAIIAMGLSAGWPAGVGLVLFGMATFTTSVALSQIEHLQDEPDASVLDLHLLRDALLATLGAVGYTISEELAPTIAWLLR